MREILTGIKEDCGESQSSGCVRCQTCMNTHISLLMQAAGHFIHKPLTFPQTKLSLNLNSILEKRAVGGSSYMVTVH